MTSREDAIPLDPDEFDPAEWRRATRGLQRIARSIVRDEAGSEDIVQGAWVRALERGDTAPRQGWLGRLVRSRAIDARRAESARPAHDDVLDSVAGDAATADEVAARIEMQRILLDAVEALDAPYRETIYLRYFEGLPVREIAARLETSPKTVETRLTRALARLRQRLAPRLRDGRGRWAPALVAFGDPKSLLTSSAVGATASGTVSALALLGGLTMKKFALVLAAAALLAAGWLAVDGLDSPDARVAADAVSAAKADDAAAPELAFVTDASRSERFEAAPDASEEPVTDVTVSALDGGGTLRVTVRWSDGEPAAGVGVVAVTPWGPKGVRRRAMRTTDDAGVALFEALPAETYELRASRSESTESIDVDVIAGETVDATLELPPGLVVEGRVVDSDGRPVPDAEIWLATASGGWTSGNAVGRSDSAGVFRLRDVPEDPSLGALAAGHLPSALVDLDLLDRSISPVSIELVVTPGGGALEGIVTDERGAPVEGAVVVFGQNEGSLDVRFDHSVAEGWGARHARTDENGLYRLDALSNGAKPLEVRRLGLAQWHGEVEINGPETARKDIVLEAGVTVTGVVTDIDGAPVEGARVQAFHAPLSESYLQSGQLDYEGAFAQEVALTAADGTYALGPLPHKTMFLYAMDPREERARMDDAMRFTKTELDLSVGEEHAWDAVLSYGRVISGTVRYEDGSPIEDIFVILKVEEGVDPHDRAIHTATGDFKFVQLPGETYAVRAQIWSLPEGHEEPVEMGVAPGGDPIELRATFGAPVEYESSTVTVRFVDDGDRAKGGNVSISLEGVDSYSWRFGQPQADGAWAFDLDEPGRYRPTAMLGERLIAVGETFDFVPGVDVDLGTLRSGPGGTLVLDVDASDEYPPEGLRMLLQHDANRHGERLELGSQRVLRLESMQPGSGKISIIGDNLLRQEVEFTVVAGEESVVDIELVPAIPVPYRIELPTLSGAVSVEVRWMNVADGSVVHQFDGKDARRLQNPMEYAIPLTPGDFRLEVELGDGRIERRDFSVTSLDDEPPRVDLRFE
ncbi:MAG: sigma-70 family RNA polymerase sigma factor [Planctomycetota bacterium]